MSVTLLCLFLCIQWTLCFGQNCSSIEPEGSSCSSSEICGQVHGASEDTECLSDVNHLAPFQPSFCSSFSCPTNGQSNGSAILNNRIRGLQASFYSINRVFFSINITWDHPINYAQGYQLEIKDRNFLLRCSCINPDMRSFVDCSPYSLQEWRGPSL